MTQEELDSLMEQEIANMPSSDEDEKKEELDDDVVSKEGDEYDLEYMDPAHVGAKAQEKWPPPPPTEEHRVVHQLDDVTKDSEVKMTQVFDQLESISMASTSIEKSLKTLKSYIKSQEESLSSLVKSFPKIKTFGTSLELTQNAKTALKQIEDANMDSADASMQAMDIMQYQDIHRQKIERVINVMRALSNYMNSLFESRSDDSKRVSSANYIAGDNSDEIASDSDIEALIASFGKK